MNERILLDTGPLVALLMQPDSHHRRCLEIFKSLKNPLCTCWPVLTEAAWLLRKQRRPLDFISQAHAGGMFTVLDLSGDELGEIAELMRRYEDIRLQLADAAIVHLAEREGIRTVFTTDRRDFSIIRLKHNRTLKLIPEIL